MGNGFNWQCPNCGTIMFVRNPERFRQCEACGVEISYEEVVRYKVVEKPVESILCLACGARISPNVKFCPECGVRIDFRPGGGSGFSWQKLVDAAKRVGESVLSRIQLKSSTLPLYRLENGKVAGGVCAGIAQKFGWNVGLLRLALSLTSCFGILPWVVAAYLVLWAILPKRSY